MQVMKKAAALVLALAFMSTTALGGEARRCVQPNGRIVYQDFDCETERGAPSKSALEAKAKRFAVQRNATRT